MIRVPLPGIGSLTQVSYLRKHQTKRIRILKKGFLALELIPKLMESQSSVILTFQSCLLGLNVYIRVNILSRPIAQNK